MKICAVEAEMFHVDRGTDGRADRHEEANSSFSQFYERSLKGKAVTSCVFDSLNPRPSTRI